MRTPSNYDILLSAIFGTLLFLLLALFVLVLLFIYRRRRKSHIREKQQMKDEFEKQLLQSQLEIQEQSFSNISQEIHDNVGQVLSLTKVQLNIIEQDEVLNRPILSEAKDNLSKAILDLRDIARGLSAERIAHFQLAENVRNEVNRIQRIGFLFVNFKIEGREQELGPDKRLIIFRIIQECLQNIIRHSKAKEVTITFHYMAEGLGIEVSDNGRGFAVQQALESNQGLGLRNIIRRAGIIGGKAVITSAIDEGTTINLFIPYV
jgi:signal transduction histidine kinase